MPYQVRHKQSWLRIVFSIVAKNALKHCKLCKNKLHMRFSFFLCTARAQGASPGDVVRRPSRTILFIWVCCEMEAISYTLSSDLDNRTHACGSRSFTVYDPWLRLLTLHAVTPGTCKDDSCAYLWLMLHNQLKLIHKTCRHAQGMQTIRRQAC